MPSESDIFFPSEAVVLLSEPSPVSQGFDCEAALSGRPAVRFVFSWIGENPPLRKTRITVDKDLDEFVIRLPDGCERRVGQGPRTYVYRH